MNALLIDSYDLFLSLYIPFLASFRPTMATTAKPDDADTRSLISLEELDPSPVTDESPDLKSGEYFPKTTDYASSQQQQGVGFFGQKLGLRGNSWDSWCMENDPQMACLVSRD